MLPSASVAIACRSDAFSSGVCCCSKMSRTSGCSGDRRSSRQREWIVGNSSPGRSQTRTSTVFGGGSSNIFSKAFCPARFSEAASSMIATRHPPSAAVMRRNGAILRTSSTVTSRATLPVLISVSRSITIRSPCPLEATRRDTGDVADIASVPGCRSAGANKYFARLKASVALPMPHSPDRISPCGNRSAAIASIKSCSTASWPRSEGVVRGVIAYSFSAKRVFSSATMRKAISAIEPPALITT